MAATRFLDPTSIPLKRQSGGNIWATLVPVIQGGIILGLIAVVGLFLSVIGTALPCVLLILTQRGLEPGVSLTSPLYPARRDGGRHLSACAMAAYRHKMRQHPNGYEMQGRGVSLPAHCSVTLLANLLSWST